MIQESKLCQSKRNAMFFLIKCVFIGIPFEIRSFSHRVMVDSGRKNVNILIWLFIWLVVLVPHEQGSPGGDEDVGWNRYGRGWMAA
jgi:hypothetical protein